MGVQWQIFPPFSIKQDCGATMYKSTRHSNCSYDITKYRVELPIKWYLLLLTYCDYIISPLTQRVMTTCSCQWLFICFRYGYCFRKTPFFMLPQRRNLKHTPSAKLLIFSQFHAESRNRKQLRCFRIIKIDVRKQRRCRQLVSCLVQTTQYQLVIGCRLGPGMAVGTIDRFDLFPLLGTALLDTLVPGTFLYLLFHCGYSALCPRLKLLWQCFPSIN